MSVIKSSSIECRCPDYTDSKTVNPPLALRAIPKGCSIFTPDFLIVTLNTFTSKGLLTLLGYQFDPL